MIKSEFKIGDKVRIIKLISDPEELVFIPNWYLKEKFILESKKIGVITDIIRNHYGNIAYYYVDFTNGDYIGTLIYPNQLELVDRKSKPKVGFGKFIQSKGL